MEKYTGYLREPFYYETDQMGIIHHSNYIRWFEEARVALLEHLDFSYKKIEEQGIIIPVLGVSCEYKRDDPLWGQNLDPTDYRKPQAHA